MSPVKPSPFSQAHLLAELKRLEAMRLDADEIRTMARGKEYGKAVQKVMSALAAR